MPKQVPNPETTAKVKEYLEKNPTKSLRKAKKALGIPTPTVIFLKEIIIYFGLNIVSLSLCT